MNPQELKERTKIFGQTCTKLALVLPQKNAMSEHLRKELLKVSFDLPSKARNLLIGQSTLSFVNKLSECSELANRCTYILEFIIDENLMETSLVTPLIDESNSLINLFYNAFKTVKDKIDS